MGAQGRLGITIAVAVLLAAGIGVGGYLLGKGKAPDQTDASAAKAAAFESALHSSSASSESSSKARGISAGSSAGARSGAENGASDGAAAGQAAVTAQRPVGMSCPNPSLGSIH